MTRPAILVFAAALAAVLLVAPREASAWCQMTTVAADPLLGSCADSGIPLAWGRRCIEYALDGGGSSDIPLATVSDIVATSLGAWTVVDCGGGPPGFQVQEADFLVDCQSSSFDQDGANVNVVAFVPDLDDRSILALTTVWYSTTTGEIFDADIMVNESQGPYADCPSIGCLGAGAPHDLENVLTHEAGHFFGLGHSTVLDSTMFASSTAGETAKRTLTADDEAGFCATYGTDPLPTTCDFTPYGGRSSSCTRSSRGCGVVGASADRRQGPSALGLLALSALAVTWGRRRLLGAIDRRRARGAASDTLRPRD